MKINKDSLKARANNIAKALNISQNVIYDRFFFDAFLSRLAVSSYKNTLVLKGGLYLSNVFGVETRSTMDIDFYVAKISMEEKAIVKLINEIISISLDDGIAFKVLGSERIRQEDRYGGFQVKILARLENIRYEFCIDIATGDPIIPSEKSFNYRCLVTNETLALKAYSLESVIAEKMQTVLARQIANSRNKDFYDLYLLEKTMLAKIDRSYLKNAFKETCKYRNFSISKDTALSITEEILVNSQMNTRWIAYTKKVQYAKGLALSDVMNSIKKWIEMLF